MMKSTRTAAVTLAQLNTRIAAAFRGQGSTRCHRCGQDNGRTVRPACRNAVACNRRRASVKAEARAAR